MNGYTGKILIVDLNDNHVQTIFTQKYSEQFIGGRDIAVKLLYELTPKNVDALSPENVLVFMTGPLTGTLAPSSGRVDVVSKSPETKLLGGANAGGFFGPELKYAGYDGIIVRGKATSPVYVDIFDDEVEIKDVQHLWGKGVFDTVKTLRKDDEDTQVACIGPAGEKLVNISGIAFSMRNYAARCGLGAVMGSKNLKAIAVRGTKGLDIANPEQLKNVAEKMRERIKNMPSYLEYPEWHYKLFRILESDEKSFFGNYENKAWGERFEAYENAEKFVKHAEFRPETCFGCPLRCWAYIHVKDVGGAGVVACQGTLTSLANFTKVKDFVKIWKAYLMCQDLGLDTSGTSAIIAYVMDLYSKEILRKADTDNLNLSEITVISEENELPYSPVALPEYIEGKISKEQLFLWDNDFIKKMSIKYLSGKSVVNVNSNEKKVVLDDGTFLSYDKLLIASGASPVLTEDLISRKGVFTLRTIQDAEAIRHHIKERAVIYGAGAVAVKIAVALHNIGVDVIMVCRSRVLRRLFDEDICRLIHDLLIANGIKIIGVHDQMRVLGDPIESLSIANQRIRTDGVIAALGVKPNTQFLNGQNIHLGSSKGVLVNEKMETSMVDVYAAGDCTETQDITSGKRHVIALWPPAVKQGEVAALNMLGMNAVYEGTLPGNVIDVFNTAFASIGSLDGEKIDIKKHGGIIRFTIKKEKLIGAQLVGDIDSAGLISSYIMKGIDSKHLDYLKIISSGKLRFNDSSLYQQHHMKSNGAKALCC